VYGTNLYHMTYTGLYDETLPAPVGVVTPSPLLLWLLLLVMSHNGVDTAGRHQ